MSWIQDFVIKRKSQRTNCFIIETEDPKRVSQFEKNAKNGKFREWIFGGKFDFDRILTFDIQRGKIYDLKTDAELPRDPTKNLMDEFDGYLQHQRTLITVKYVTVDRHAEMLTDWLTACAYDEQVFEKLSTIVVFTSNARLFSDTTRRFVHTIMVNPSTPEERKAILEDVVAKIQRLVEGAFDKKISLKISDEIIQSSSGLTLHDVETAAIESFIMHRKFTVEHFSNYKIELLKQKDVRYVIPERGFESVGGYNYLKQYIQNNIIKVLRNPDIARHYGLRIPRGIILYGTPGCGKTFLAKALAKEVGLAMIEVSSATFMRGIVGESLPHSEEILTQNGLLPIGEVVEKCVPKAYTFNGKTVTLEEVKDYIPHSKPQVIVRIKTRSGREVKVTKDHSILAAKDGTVGFYRPVELRVNNDFLAIPRRINISKDTNIDEKIGEIVGLWLADGTAGEKLLRFSTKDRTIVELLTKTLNQAKPYYSRKRRIYDVQVRKSKISDFPELLTLSGDCYTKRVPTVFFSANREARASLLRGLFSGDGGFHGHAVEYSTYSRGLASDVLYLLLSFGIVGRCSKRIDSHGKTEYRITITGFKQLQCFATEIGFIQHRKNETLNNYLVKRRKGNDWEQRLDYVPLSSELVKAFTGRTKYWTKENVIHRRALESRLKLIDPERKLQKLWWLVEAEIFWDEIEEIEEEENIERVYDISMNPTETFIGGFGGVILHNTESRVTQLTQLIESLSPIIVFIDEIDEIALRRDQALVTDSIPSYSPIMVRRVDNSIDILSLEDLFLEISHKPHTETTTENGEQILKPLEPYWVRTTPNARRWTKLRYILRHFYEGPLVRILAGGGLVEVTPNHSVYTAKSHLGQHDNHLRNPRTIKAGEELAILSCDIPKTKPADLFFYGGEDLAWLYGFFVAEGSAYIHHKNNFQVSFSNNNEQLLEKASKIMEHYFGKERPIISELRKDRNDPTLKYVWNGRSLFKWFRHRFYSSNLKRVPAEILTAPKKIQQAFIEGYLDGDGTQRGIQRCDTNSMILAEGLRYILNLLGQKVRLQTRHDKQNIITLNFVQGTGHALIPVCKVKSTSEKHYTGYVYDIETESHRFYTGVGPVLVHNSGVRRSMQNLLMKWLGDEKRQSFIVGATNLLESCDPAFYRAGRIDEAILVLPPDLEARKQILQIHTSVLRKVPLDKNVNLDNIAEKTFLFTGGELEKLVLDASRTAMKEESETVKQEHFETVLEGTKINVKERQDRVKQMVSTMEKLEIVNQAFLSEALKLFAKAEKDEGRLKGFLEIA